MSLGSLLPVGGAALGVLAAKAASGVAQGGFRALLEGLSGTSESPAATSSASTPPPLNLQEAVPDFVEQLQQQLAAAGFELPSDLTLRSDGRGRMTVETDHPQRAEIEELLHNSPELMNQFQQLVATATEQRQRLAIGNDSQFGDFLLAVQSGQGAIGFE